MSDPRHLKTAETRQPEALDLRGLTLGRDADGQEGRDLYGQTYAAPDLAPAPFVAIDSVRSGGAQLQEVNPLLLVRPAPVLEASAPPAPPPVAPILPPPAPMPPPSPWLRAFSDDTGRLGDGLTADSTPTISGTAAPGLLVQIYRDGTLVGTARADAQGLFTFTESTPLSDGVHHYVAVAVDEGLRSAPSNELGLRIDATLPDIRVPDLAAASDTGWESADDVTRARDLIIEGRAEASARVILREQGGEIIGTVEADAEGRWSLTWQDAAEGTWTLAAEATDAAGNIARSASLLVEVDHTPPAVPVLAFDHEASASSDRVILIEGEAGSRVTVLRDGQPIATVVLDEQGRASVEDANLPDGRFVYSASAEDRAGNWSEGSPDLSTTVDTAAPLVSTPDLAAIADTGWADNDDITRAETLVLTGTAEAGVRVALLSGETVLGETVANQDGQWSFTWIGAAEGPHSLRAIAADAAGNLAVSGDLEVLVDRRTAISAAALAEGSDTGVDGADNVTAETRPVITVLAEAGTLAQLVVDGQPVGEPVLVQRDPADADGLASRIAMAVPDALGDGIHSAFIRITDAAGNTADSEALTFTVDTRPPAPVGIVQGATILIPLEEAVAAGTLSPAEFRVQADSETIGVTEAAIVETSLGPSIQLTLSGPIGAGKSVAVTFTPAADRADQPIDTAGNAVGSFSLQFETPSAAPAAPQLLGFSDDTGVPGDGLTRDATPTITGMAEAGASVALLRDGIQVASLVADADGHFSFTEPSAIADGRYTYEAIATTQGGTSAPSAPLTLTVDATSPGAPSIDLAPQSDSGWEDSDNHTNAAVLRVIGGAEPGARVVLFADGQEIGSAIAGTDGLFTFDWVGAEEKAADLSARAIDAAGNISAAGVLTVTVDRTPPAVPTLNVEGGDHRATGPVSIAISGEPMSQVSIFRDGTLVGVIGLDSTGGATFFDTLGDGSYRYSASAEDRAGNRSGEGPATLIVVDGTPPAAPEILAFSDDTGRSASDAITRDGTPTLSGRAEPGAKVDLYLVQGDGQPDAYLGQAQADANGNWSYELHLGDGAYRFRAVAEDAVGNRSVEPSSPFDLTVDLTPPYHPSITGFAPISESLPVQPIGSVVTRPYAITGTSEPNAIIRLTDGEGAPLGITLSDANGAWSLQIRLPEGRTDLVATAEDVAGNVSAPSLPYAASLDFTVPFISAPDLEAASDSGASSNDDITNAADPRFTGTAEPGSRITLYAGEVAVTTTWADAQGHWAATWVGAPEGQHRLQAFAEDGAGNRAGGAILDITIDRTIAAGPIRLAEGEDTGISDSDNLTRDSVPAFVATGEPGALAQLYVDGEAVGAPVRLTGTGPGLVALAAATLAPLPDGAHTAVFGFEDAAGNRSFTDPLLIQVDTSAPAAVSIFINQLVGLGFNEIIVGGAFDPAELHLTADGAPLAIATVSLADAQGRSTLLITPADPLPSGAEIVVTYTPDPSRGGQPTDAAGNPVAGFTSVLGFRPLPPVLTGYSNDTGLLGDGHTGDATPTITGTAHPGLQVVIFRGGIEVDVTTSGPDGRFTFTEPGNLPDGPHSYTAEAVSRWGRSGPSAPLTLTIDATPPGAPAILAFTDDTGWSASDALSNDATPVLSGTAEAGAAVDVYRFMDDGIPAQWLGRAATDGAGHWSLALALPEGDYSLFALAEDKAGNRSVGASAYFEFTLDLTPPAVPVIAAAVPGEAFLDGGTILVPVSLRGEAEPGSRVRIYADQTLLGTVEVAGDGSWSLETRLPEGAVFITAEAEDRAGNISERAPATGLNLAAATPVTPELDLRASSDTGWASDDDHTRAQTLEVDIRGGANTPVTIFVDGVDAGTVSLDTDGRGVFRYGPAEGAGRLEAVASNAAGKLSAPAILNVTVDRTAPEIPAIDPSQGSGVLVGASREVAFTISGEAGTRAIVFRDGQEIATLTLDAAGRAEFRETLPSDGFYAYTAQGEDRAGNRSSVSAPTAITVDGTAPPPPTIDAFTTDTGWSPVDAITNEGHPLLRGTATPGVRIDIYAAAEPQLGILATTTADATGAWSATVALPDGIHRLVGIAQDAAGNRSSPSAVPLVLTVDQMLPPAPYITAVTRADDGRAQGIFTTQDLVVEGLAEPETRISVYYAGSATPSIVYADSTGFWRTTVTVPEGQSDIFANSEDRAGNLSAYSPQFPVSVDITPPFVTAPDLLADDDTGAAATDNITKASDLRFTGWAEAGATIEISDGDTVIGATQADATGAWQWTLPTASEGTHQISAIARDAAGNESASPAVTVIVDRQIATPGIALDPASDTGISNSDGLTNAQTIRLTGTAEPGSSVVLTRTTFGLSYAVATVTADPSGQWEYTWANPPTGSHFVRAVATDLAGNTSATATLGVYVDRGATAGLPDLVAASDSGISATDNITNDTTPTVTGSSAEGALAVVLLNGSEVARFTPAIPTGSLNWSWTPETPLADGTYQVSWILTDKAGNVSAPSPALTMKIDSGAAPPTLVVNPTGTAGYYTITGSAEPGAKVDYYVNGNKTATLWADASGNWSYATSSYLADGTVLTARQTDTAGNLSAFTEVSVGEVAPPTAPPATPVIDLLASSDSGRTSDDNLTNATNLTFEVTGTPGATIEVQLQGAISNTQSFTMGPSGTYQVTFANVPEGSIRAVAFASNAGGNAPGFGEVTVMVDRSSLTPTAILDPASDTSSPTDGITSDATPTFYGQVERDSDVVILLDGVEQASFRSSSASLDWSWTPAAPIADGSHTLVVRSTDAAGNTVLSAPVSIRMDTRAPTAAAPGTANDATIIIPLDEVLAADTSATTAFRPADFAVTIGGLPATVSAALYRAPGTEPSLGSSPGIKLLLTSSMLGGEAIQVTYTPNMLTGSAQDEAGSPAQGFTVAPVNTTAPTTLSAAASAGRLDSDASPIAPFGTSDLGTGDLTATLIWDPRLLSPALDASWSIVSGPTSATATKSGVQEEDLAAIVVSPVSIQVSEPSAPGELGAVITASITLTVATAYGANRSVTAEVPLTQATGYSSADDVTLPFNVTGGVVDLLGGSDALRLQAGANTLGLANVETVHGSAMADTLTLNSLSGFDPATGLVGLIDLAGGSDTLDASATPVSNLGIRNIETVLMSNTADRLHLYAGTDTTILVQADLDPAGAATTSSGGADTIYVRSGINLSLDAGGNGTAGGVDNLYIQTAEAVTAQLAGVEKVVLGIPAGTYGEVATTADLTLLNDPSQATGFGPDFDFLQASTLRLTAASNTLGQFSATGDAHLLATAGQDTLSLAGGAGTLTLNLGEGDDLLLTSGAFRDDTTEPLPTRIPLIQGGLGNDSVISSIAADPETDVENGGPSFHAVARFEGVEYIQGNVGVLLNTSQAISMVGVQRLAIENGATFTALTNLDLLATSLRMSAGGGSIQLSAGANDLGHVSGGYDLVGTGFLGGLVSGTDSADVLTLRSVTSLGTIHFETRLGGGDDSLMLERGGGAIEFGVGTTPFSGTSAGGFLIDGGAGYDTAYLYGYGARGAAAILRSVERAVGDDANQQVLLLAETAGPVRLDLGGGTDDVFLETGTGAQPIALQGNSFERIFSVAGTTSDVRSVTFSDTQDIQYLGRATGSGGLAFNLAAGTNTFQNIDSGLWNFIGNAGNDLLDLGAGGLLIGTVTVNLGTGNDQLWLGAAGTFIPTMTVSGGAGTDTLTLRGATSGTLSVASFESISAAGAGSTSQTVTMTAGGTAAVDLGAGADTLILQGAGTTLSLAGVERLTFARSGGASVNLNAIDGPLTVSGASGTSGHLLQLLDTATSSSVAGYRITVDGFTGTIRADAQAMNLHVDATGLTGATRIDLGTVAHTVSIGAIQSLAQVTFDLAKGTSRALDPTKGSTFSWKTDASSGVIINDFDERIDKLDLSSLVSQANLASRTRLFSQDGKDLNLDLQVLVGSSWTKVGTLNDAVTASAVLDGDGVGDAVTQAQLDAILSNWISTGVLQGA